MIGKINIGKFRSKWILRHRWEKGAKEGMISNYEGNQIRKNWQLGIFAKKYEVLGPTKKRKNNEDTIRKTFNKSNHVNCYMIGLNLIVCKVWVDFSIRPTMSIKID